MRSLIIRTKISSYLMNIGSADEVFLSVRLNAEFKKKKKMRINEISYNVY